MTIVFVCTGNTCRSPMAEALMRQELHRRGIVASVTSAGLFADGAPITDNAATVLSEVGADMFRHRSRPFTREIAEAADVVVAMTDDHRRLLCAAGVPEDKICLAGGGITDPFGGDLAVYRKCRDQIAGAVRQLADALFGEEDA